MWLSGYVRDNKIDYCKESLILHRELGNLSGISESLGILAGITLKMGDFSSITPWLEEALSISRQLGNHASALVLVNFGNIAYWQGNYRRANEYYKESLILCEITGNQLLYIFVHVNMAYAILRQGDIQQAREIFEICIRDMQNTGSLSGVVYCIEGVASLIANHEQASRAARLFAWADAVREKMGDHRLPLVQDSIEKDLAVIHSKIDDTEFARLSTEGKSMTMEQAIELALQG
jgi:tetratricopeptide (TPR) repeat protein